MIKKNFIFLFIIILLSSCGKKGDPFYNKENQSSKITITSKNKLS